MLWLVCFLFILVWSYPWETKISWDRGIYCLAYLLHSVIQRYQVFVRANLRLPYLCSSLNKRLHLNEIPKAIILSYVSHLKPGGLLGSSVNYWNNMFACCFISLNGRVYDMIWRYIWRICNGQECSNAAEWLDCWGQLLTMFWLVSVFGQSSLLWLSCSSALLPSPYRCVEPC